MHTHECLILFVGCVAATQLMTPERRRAIWAIYGKQTHQPHMPMLFFGVSL
jgi:hypothetical protein